MTPRTGTVGATATATAPAPAVVRTALWRAVHDRDEYAATAAVLDALDRGLDAESALLDVIAPVQAAVGDDWAANRITVAQEHAASAINDRVVAAVARHGADRTGPSLGLVTVACVDHEWHVLPARLLAEVLALRGWRVDFLGAQVPVNHLVAHLHQTLPDTVALSSSLATRLPAAHSAITASQAVGVPVLVGGAAFGPDGRYARLLGADAWAPDARAAADRLAEGMARPDLTGLHEPVDDLPHLADQEYTMVSRSSAQLVRSALAVLEGRFPELCAHGTRQRRHTAEDLAHIVDFLGAALYVDDDRLFNGFLAWTADILTARAVPAYPLYAALDALGAQLTDFPRSVRLLDSARRALRDHLADSGPREAV